MDEESQISIHVGTGKKAVEYLLDEQPIHMIRGGFVTKDDIRQAVEDPDATLDETYIKLFFVPNLILLINIIVKVDPVLKIVMSVEKHIF